MTVNPFEFDYCPFCGKSTVLFLIEGLWMCLDCKHSREQDHDMSEAEFMWLDDMGYLGYGYEVEQSWELFNDYKTCDFVGYIDA